MEVRTQEKPIVIVLALWGMDNAILFCLHSDIDLNSYLMRNKVNVSIQAKRIRV